MDADDEAAGTGRVSPPAPWGAVDGGWPVSPFPGVCFMVESHARESADGLCVAAALGAGLLLVLALYLFG